MANNKLTTEQAKDTVLDLVTNSDFDSFEVDNEGQVIVYTGIYRWKNGTYNMGPEDLSLSPNDIPADWPVQPLKPGEPYTSQMTCDTCGLSWDDAVSTSLTPTPSTRCPFEDFHK